MGFCPFYSKTCPETGEGTTGCACYNTTFGCTLGCKPGTPAVYNGTDNVYILEISSSNAKISGDILIIYADATTGVIGNSDTLSDFVINV